MAAETENERCCSKKPFCLSSSFFFFFHHRQQRFFRSESWIKGSLGLAAQTLYQRLVSCKPGVCCCHLVRGHLTLNLSPSSGLPSTWTSTKQGATSREGRRSSAVCGSASDLICACRCFPPNASGFTRGATTVLLLLLCLYTL